MKKNFLMMLVLLPLTYSCVKEISNVDLLDTPAVLTQYDTSVDFSQFSTFAIVDSISFISDDPSKDKRIATPNALQLLSRVKSEMLNRGYTASNVASADLGINVSIIHQLNLVDGAFLAPGYWWGYDGYWDQSYWGYNDYPWYYGYNYNYTYDSGALLIELYDLKNAASTNRLKIIWNAEIGDIYNTDINLSEALESITQAFEQSSYLQK